MEESTLIEEYALDGAETEENILNEDIENGLLDTISGGDASGNGVIPMDMLTIDDIVTAIESSNIQTYSTMTDSVSFFEKPLEEYTTSECLLLILVLCAIGLVIEKIIGGVLNCTKLLKK